MHVVDQPLALLAGELALATSGRSVVCIGCPVSGWGEAPVPLLLASLPFEAFPLRGKSVQLVVARYSASDLELARQCARAGVKEVWLLPSGGDELERLSEPLAGRYRRRSPVWPGESVPLIAVPDVRLTPLPGAARPN